MSTTTTSSTVVQLIRALAGQETGRSCRGCGESIPMADPFGRSEGVCYACRRASGS